MNRLHKKGSKKDETKKKPDRNKEMHRKENRQSKYLVAPFVYLSCMLRVNGCVPNTNIIILGMQ